MTELQTPETQPSPEARPFSAGALIGGLALSLCVGAIANIIAGLIAIGASNGPLGFLVGMAPGGLFVLWGAILMRHRSAFGTGLLIGGCIIGLIGGACGASMVGTSFH